MSRFRSAASLTVGVFGGVLLTLAVTGVVTLRARQDPAQPSLPGEPSLPPPRQNTPSSAPSAEPQPPAQPGEALPVPRLEAAPAIERVSPVSPQPGTPPATTAVAADSDTDDPERAATLFVEKTRQEASAAIDSLRKEADALKQRLRKVEAALRRWESLRSAVSRNPALEGEHLPGQLEAIPQALPADPVAPAAEARPTAAPGPETDRNLSPPIPPADAARPVPELPASRPSVERVNPF
jgi:hypothetical protein